MLDAIAPGAAVFEPEEVDVLAAACTLALRKIGRTGDDSPETCEAVARLVHNLGRSRLRHHKRLRDATDAASLAEEAADLLGYLREGPDLSLTAEHAPPMARAVPIFPADFRAPPTDVLEPLPSSAPLPASVKRKRMRVNASRPGRNVKSRSLA